VAVAFSARQSTRQEFRKFQQQELERVHSSGGEGVPVGKVAAALDGRCCGEDAGRSVSEWLGSSLAAIVLDERGTLVAALGQAVTEMTGLQAADRDGELSIQGTRGSGGAREDITVRFRGEPGVPIFLADGRRAALYVVPLPQREDTQPAVVFLGSVDRRLVLATSLVGLLAIVMTWAVTRRIVGPIGEVRRAAKDLAGGDLSRRVDTRGSDEIAELGQAFNVMAAELERQQALRRNLVHDVAHELRTPLTAVRCRVETLLDGLATSPSAALQDVHDEIGHLSRLVDDLQELALAEARELRLSIGDVRLAEVVESAVRAVGLEGDARLQVALEPALVARADVVRVRQILLNLLTNAARHAPQGSTIVVRARRDRSEVALEVQNTGSSLDAAQIDRVFDRFYRADPSRQRATGGSGLGLAIVKHLVEAQGGRVWAASDAARVTFGFSLPASAGV